MNKLNSYVQLSLLSLAVLLVGMFVLPDVYADEIIAITLDLQKILLDSDEVIPLLNTNNIGNMSKVTVSATLPCNSSNVPDLKITGGVLGNTTDIISTSGDYVSLRGPFDTCLFENTIDISNATVPALNRIFLTNDGSSSVLTNLGTTITLTGIFVNQTSESSSSFNKTPSVYYEFDNDDVSGSTLDNLGTLGASGDGTITGADTGITGIRDEAFEFIDTNTDTVEFGDVADCEYTATCSWSFWVNTGDNAGAGHVMHKLDNASTVGWYIVMSASEEITFVLGTGSYKSCTSDTIVPLNEWTHIVVTSAGDDTTTCGSVKIYINGVSSSLTDASSGTLSGSSLNAKTFRMGANHQGTPANYLNAQLDDLAIFTTVLSPTEISQIYNSGNSLDLVT